MHGDVYAALPLALGGIVLCGVYYLSRNAYASMISHALFNGLSIVLLSGVPAGSRSNRARRLDHGVGGNRKRIELARGGGCSDGGLVADAGRRSNSRSRTYRPTRWIASGFGSSYQSGWCASQSPTMGTPPRASATCSGPAGIPTRRSVRARERFVKARERFVEIAEELAESRDTFAEILIVH